MNMTKASSNRGTEVNPYTRLVSLPIHSENVFHFPDGIPAFENCKEFVFLFKGDTAPFIFMHALGPTDLTFACVDPFMICDDYKPKINESDTDFLHIKSPSDIFLLSIVTVARDMRETTANLQAPIAINIQACIGKQIICDGQHYPIRYKIWDGLNAMAPVQKEQEEIQLPAAV